MGNPHDHLAGSAICPCEVRYRGELLFTTNHFVLFVISKRNGVAFDHRNATKQAALEFGSEPRVVFKHQVAHVTLRIVGPFSAEDDWSALKRYSSAISLNALIC